MLIGCALHIQFHIRIFYFDIIAIIVQAFFGVKQFTIHFIVVQSLHVNDQVQINVGIGCVGITCVAATDSDVIYL